MDIAAILSAVGAVASAVATIVLVGLTGKYVKLTHSLVEESRQAKYPNVFVDIEFDGIDVKFLVGNSGTTPALDIRFDVKDQVPWRKIGDRASGITAITAVQKGISYLAPGRTLKFSAGYVDHDPKFYAEGSTIDVTLAFKTEAGAELHREFTIDFQSYSGILFETFRDPQREVARAIRDSEHDRRSDESITGWMRNMLKKKCPSCGELVASKAIKCPHCHEVIPESAPKEGSDS
ncbi:zinc ribbon domain-containing protein [Nitrosomonas sp. Is37]|uniref:zinc ribbon domain-containing protein n=1 Tax=Nitrosomonas sp. Is37 TaxID=3080535 RepID=UPI00294B747D|nr:zinc ribbon domain-containing protein [Nitrosomonas sp. Is37]MDV6343145.1 zinc ribbon domain-containing protein [Nitrosomonas sp. Is37]